VPENGCSIIIIYIIQDLQLHRYS